MRVVLGIGKGMLKALILAAVVVGSFVMNCIGAIICAISSN